MKHIDDNNTDDVEEQLSKSQRKRDMHELQDLGEELSKLSLARLKKMDLPEPLLDALIAAQQIHARGAHKRQLQLIGKIMRGIDAEPIRARLEELNNESRLATKKFHHLEIWRDKLIEAGDKAISEFIELHHDIDKQAFRQLVRNAQKEKQAQKAPHYSRKLFQFLKQVIIN